MDRNRDRRDRDRDREKSDGLTEKLIKINRVAKVVKGGRRFSFSAVVVVGDQNGKVGYGFGKANDITEAIRKAVERAKSAMIQIPMKNSTIPHEIIGKYKGASVLLKPAVPGTGVIAGGAVRAIMELGGVKDILTKVIGRTSNPINVSYATMSAVKNLRTPEEIRRLRGKERKEA